MPLLREENRIRSSSFLQSPQQDLPATRAPSLSGPRPERSGCLGCAELRESVRPALERDWAPLPRSQQIYLSVGPGGQKKIRGESEGKQKGIGRNMHDGSGGHGDARRRDQLQGAGSAGSWKGMGWEKLWNRAFV